MKSFICIVCIYLYHKIKHNATILFKNHTNSLQSVTVKTYLHVSSCYVQTSIAILYNMNKPEMSNAGLKLYVCDRPELWHLAAR